MAKNLMMAAHTATFVLETCWFRIPIVSLVEWHSTGTPSGILITHKCILIVLLLLQPVNVRLIAIIAFLVVRVVAGSISS